MERAGALGWSPETLANATLPELIYHFRGWQRANGIDPDATTNLTGPMTKAEGLALFEKYDRNPKQ